MYLITGAIRGIFQRSTVFKLQNVSLILHLQCVYYGVRQMQTAHGQVNEVNIAVKCSNRLTISKLDLQRTESLRAGNLLKHFTKRFTSFTCTWQSAVSGNGLMRQ